MLKVVYRRLKIIHVAELILYSPLLILRGRDCSNILCNQIERARPNNAQNVLENARLSKGE